MNIQLCLQSTNSSDMEKRYSQLDKKALDIIFSVHKFHKFIYDRLFKLVIYHEPLKQILYPSKSNPQLSATHLQHWVIIVSAYNYKIVYKKGECNSNVDGFSRLPLDFEKSVEKKCFLVSVVSSFQNKLITFKTIEQEICMDDILVKVVKYLKNGWLHFSQLNENFKIFHKNHLMLSLESDCILFGNHVMIPKSLQIQVLELLHKDHPRIVCYKLLFRSCVWWPNIEIDILVCSKFVQSFNAK